MHYTSIHGILLNLIDGSHSQKCDAEQRLDSLTDQIQSHALRRAFSDAVATLRESPCRVPSATIEAITEHAEFLVAALGLTGQASRVAEHCRTQGTKTKHGFLCMGPLVIAFAAFDGDQWTRAVVQRIQIACDYLAEHVAATFENAMANT